MYALVRVNAVCTCFKPEAEVKLLEAATHT